MIIRFPEFDLANATPHWGDNHEACAIINSGAIIVPEIERYLIKVMRQAAELLDPVRDADLLQDIDLFNRQEGQHRKLHAELVTMLANNGYPKLKELEAGFIADLNGFLAEKPLEWNIAYCEGFESSGTALAEGWLDGHVAALCEDRGSEVMRMWMWHMTEEFEHRSVVHDVLERLYGPDKAFELRCLGATENRAHLGTHSYPALQYILEIDRASMTPDEVADSLLREQQAITAMMARNAEPNTWVFQPGYDPRAVTAPAGWAGLLEEYAPA
jgi:uncharacterized protein